MDNLSFIGPSSLVKKSCLSTGNFKIDNIPNNLVVQLERKSSKYICDWFCFLRTLFYYLQSNIFCIYLHVRTTYNHKTCLVLWDYSLKFPIMLHLFVSMQHLFVLMQHLFASTSLSVFFIVSPQQPFRLNNLICGHKLQQRIFPIIKLFSYWHMPPMACHVYRIGEISMIASSPRPGHMLHLAYCSIRSWNLGDLHWPNLYFPLYIRQQHYRLYYFWQPSSSTWNTWTYTPLMNTPKGHS